LLRFYISPKSRSDDSKNPYRLILNSIGEYGGNLSFHWDNNLKIKNININVVEEVLKKYSNNSMKNYITSLATAKLCGDIQYLISSLICSANINDDNKNQIFMDSSKDYSAIFNVLSLEYCKYFITGKSIFDETNTKPREVNLNDKNIIGNLVSIRDKGTNFVPKSERMINIITLMYLCIKNQAVGNQNDSRQFQILINMFNCIKSNSLKILQTGISNLEHESNDNQNILLGPMGIHEPSWFLFNKFYKNDYRDRGFPNNCFDEYKYQINIKELLSKYKMNVYNFTYTSMDYWIAEKIYDYIISEPLSTSSSSNSNSNIIYGNHRGGSKKNKTIRKKRNKKNKTNRKKRNRRNRKNKTIRKKRKRKNKTIKYV
jgi:hypothetical protein